MSDGEDGLLDTRLLMTASAVYMGLIGLLVGVFSDTLLAYFGLPTEGMASLLLRLVGGLYLGFAILNWMARGNLIGGIYSRPVAIGNFMHFFIAAIIFAQQFLAAPSAAEFLGPGGASAVFAAGFGYITFGKGGGCLGGDGASCG